MLIMQGIWITGGLPQVTLSTTESEYMAVAEVAKEVL